MSKRRRIPLAPALSGDAQRFLEDLQKETDRGVALAAVAFIEDALGSLLRAVFVDDATVVGGVLNKDWSLQPRADLAYCLGQLPSDCRNDLLLINQIRNAFAHSHVPVSFDDPAVAALIESLRIVKVVYPADIERMVCRYNDMSSRSKFICDVSIIMMTIIGAAFVSAHAVSRKNLSLAACAFTDGTKEDASREGALTNASKTTQ